MQGVMQGFACRRRSVNARHAVLQGRDVSHVCERRSRVEDATRPVAVVAIRHQLPHLQVGLQVYRHLNLHDKIGHAVAV